MKPGDICPHCNEGKLEFVPENYPWTIDHLQCEKCDSTYLLFESN